MKWVSVHEQLPKLKESVLIYSPSYNYMDITWFTSEGKFLFQPDLISPEYYNDDEVSHWMPLPPPPGSEQCEKPCELCRKRHESYHIPKVKK